MRAADLPPILTVVLHGGMIVSGGPTQVHLSPAVAAGKLPINTVGTPGGKIGPPTCGTGPVVAGQACISETRAAGGIQASVIRAGRAKRAFEYIEQITWIRAIRS